MLATQNPIEYEGTFPLPESQLDRFMLRVRLGYPKRDEEMRILDQAAAGPPNRDAGSRSPRETELLEVQQAVREIFVDDLIRRYIVELVNATPQPSRRLRRGQPARGAGAACGPRKALALAAWPRLRHSRRCQGADGARPLASRDRAAVGAGKGYQRRVGR